MLSRSNFIIIGSTGRNSGKTEFACRIIRSHSKEKKIFGVKIVAINKDRTEVRYIFLKIEGNPIIESSKYSTRIDFLKSKYDYIIANDVIEHMHSPHDLFLQLIPIMKKRSFLYIGMPDPDGIADIKNLDKELMRLHLPFHRTMISLEKLRELGKSYGLDEVRIYKRSYMDTMLPFVNYKFLNELNGALGHIIDKAFDPISFSLFFRNPMLLFWGFCGYFFPCAYEPAVLWRKK